MGFVELHCHSYFSLLRASSSPEDLVAQAKAFGMPALTLTDCDTLAGAMRFYVAAREANVKPIFGSQVTLEDGSDVVLLAEDQGGYANLCRIITRSRCDGVKADSAWLGKTEPAVTWGMLAEHAQGLIVITNGCDGVVTQEWGEKSCEAAQQRVSQWVEWFGRDNVYVELQQHHLADDATRIMALARIASELKVPLVATGGTRYATKAYAELCDCLIAIDHNCTLTDARQRKLLLPNRTFALPSPEDMAKRFAKFPDAVCNTQVIAERCNVSLDFSAHRMPHFPFVPNGQTEFSYLYNLCHGALPRKYPDLQPAVLKQMSHELDVIKRNGLMSFFLIISDVMRFAREREIRGQGRGSAAGSIVAYLLDISACDPLQHNLLFERFLSDSRFIMPDVDVDFDHSGRQHVVDYLYQTYGHDHVALVANHVTYRARSALRDLGKALGFPNAAIDRLAKTCDRHEPAAAADQLEEGVHADDEVLGQRHPVLKLARLMRQIDGAVRHLSVHSAGVLIAGEPLHHMIPVQPTTMPGNFIVEFNKEDVEDAGQIKFDALMLRTLGAISVAVELIERRHGQGHPVRGGALDLYAIPFDDPAVYEVICSAKTVTLFQVESRAQQQRLPLTQPRTLEELAIQIAIIRPGPIQSGALHPYLRRVKGEELVRYPHPLLEPVLRETKGVWLYQEQILRTAIVIANFTPTEADQLRRALSRNRSEAAMAALRDRFLAGARANGVSADDAERIYQAISFFSGFGFNKSHAVSFAVIAYQTAWLLQYYPTEWYCAFLNAQPLGFYSSEVVVNDAKRRGIKFLPPCINRSAWGYVIEGEKTLRKGMQSMAGMGESHWQSILAARAAGSFAELSDFCRRVRLPEPFVSDLIRAGLFDAIGKRRELLWQLGAIEHEPDMLPVEMPVSQVDLPVLSELESTIWDYELTGLSVAGQFMRHYRSAMQRAGVLTTVQVNAMPVGKRVRVAGMLVTVQRPQTARGVVFAALEDEHGLLNMAMMPDKWKQFRSLMRGEHLLLIQGLVQRESNAVTVLISDMRVLRLEADNKQHTQLS